MKTLEINGAVVETDGSVVWVNTGINLGRYGPLAVDVHHAEEEQLGEGKHCIDCFKRTADPDADWSRFKASMQKAHGIDIPDDFKPKTLYEYAGFQYEVVRGPITGEFVMKAIPGQHPAAYKATHGMAAREQYLEDRSR